MKAASAALISLLASQSQYAMQETYTFTLADGTVVTYTYGDDPIGFDDVSYRWVNGVNPGTMSLHDSNRVARFTPDDIGESASAYTGVDIVGKKYVEILIQTRPGTMPVAVGIGTTANQVFYTAGSGSYMSGNGGCGLTHWGYYNNGVETADVAYFFEQGDIIGIAYDATTRKLWFSKNNVWLSGDPAAGTGPTMTAAANTYRFQTNYYSCFEPAIYEQKIISKASEQVYGPPSGFSAYEPES